MEYSNIVAKKVLDLIWAVEKEEVNEAYKYQILDILLNAVRELAELENGEEIR